MDKKFVRICTTWVLCLSLVGCSSTSSDVQKTEETTDQETAFIAGKYSSSATGHHGDITVEVEVSDHEILSVNVVGNTDTHLISESAIEVITKQVIEYQTYDVDTVAGATLSSLALKRAIRNSLDQAGDVSNMDKKPEANRVDGDDQTYDIVVVGAGTAGITAAIAAATDDDGEQNDLNILLAEKLAFAGGSFIVSGAGIYNPYGTEGHKNGTFTVTDEDLFVDYLTFRSDNDQLGILNDALIRKVYHAIDPAERILENAGAPFSIDDAYTTTFNDPNYEKLAASDSWAEICCLSPTYDALEYQFYEENGYGSVADSVGGLFIDTVKKYDNINLQVNSAVTGLIVENGDIVGVLIEETNYSDNTVATYRVLAQKVILATGSPLLNKEIIEKYNADFLIPYPYTEAGQTGDGIQMLLDADLDPVIQGYGGMCYNGASMSYAMEDGLALNDTGAPVVNKSGERYYNESMTAAYDTGKNTMMQEDNTAYIIFDSTSEFYNGTTLWYYEGLKDPDETLYEYAVRKGWMTKADTLEELAESIGVDKDTFLKTIEDFNLAADGEIVDTLGGVPEYMQPVKEGPFYALTIHAYAIESYVSLKTADGSTNIVNSDGEVINNLYGAGTLIASNVYYGNYYNYDGGLTAALAMGYVAGHEARDTIAK